MLPHHLELRLKHLEDNIRQEQELLKDYEDAWRYEDEPRRKAKYSREIEQLKESANCYQKEYDELRRQITCEETVQMQNLAIQLQDIHNRVDRLYAGQKAIYSNINHLRKELFARYDASENNIITSMTNELNESQAIMVSNLLDAIESNKISEAELQRILPSIEQSLTLLQQQGITLPINKEDFAEVINAPQIDFKHRIKVAVPLIPLILQYEGELELGTGMNLKEALKQLLSKVRGT